MLLKRLIAGTALAGSLGATALGFGAPMVNAEPLPGPGPAFVQQGRPDIPWRDRDAYNRAGRDHRPFQYEGRWVNPVFDPGYRAWGFWLGPIWIPL